MPFVHVSVCMLYLSVFLVLSKYINTLNNGKFLILEYQYRVVLIVGVKYSPTLERRIGRLPPTPTSTPCFALEPPSQIDGRR